jgi:hypothetical protein
MYTLTSYVYFNKIKIVKVLNYGWGYLEQIEKEIL